MRTELDTIKAVKENVMPKNTLFVPIELSAWLVNKQVINPVSASPDLGIRRWQNAYTALQDFSTPEQSIEAGASSQDLPKVGIYLHWNMPASLRHAPQSTEQEQTFVFPSLPNRWLVVRYSGPSADRTATAWVVDSDEIGSDEVTSSKFPIYDEKTGPSATRIGRVRPLAIWQEDSKQAANLTAIATGDISFTQYQPAHQNIFSIHDPMSVDKDTLSYQVIGWYADEKADPFSSCQNQNDCQDMLRKLRWYIAGKKDLFTKCQNQHECEQKLDELHWGFDNSIIVQQTLFHGMINKVEWQQDHTPDSAQANLQASQIKVAVGNTAMGALTALIQQLPLPTSEDPLFDLYDLLKAMKGGLLERLEELDSEHELEHALHQQGFGREPGGTEWEIVAKESPDKTALPPNKLSPQEIKLLNLLNQQQRQFDEQTRELSFKYNKLYGLWWKNGAIWQQESQPQALLNYINHQLDPKVDDSLINQVNKVKQTIEQLKRQIQENKNKLDSILKSDQNAPAKQLKSFKKSNFWHPIDPVVLMTAIPAPRESKRFYNYEQQEDDLQKLYLPCRNDSNLITAFKLNDQTSITDTILQKCMMQSWKDLSLSPLPKTFQPAIAILLQENFLLDPYNAPAIAPSAATELQHFIEDPLHPINKIQGGCLPTFGLEPWHQPWQPLFMQWAIEWIPLPFTDWKFKGNQYILDTKKNHPGIETYYAGRTLLSKQASFSFGARLQQLIEHDSVIKQRFPDWKTYIQDIQKMHLFSQRLSGLHYQWIEKDIRLHRIPHVDSADKVEKQVASVLNNQGHLAPIPGSLSNPTSYPDTNPDPSFQPLRAGQFYIQQLNIVDIFGQAINIIDQKTETAPFIEEELQTRDAVVGNPKRYIQLPPRIVQSGRVKAQWVDAREDSKTQDQHVDCNPICGWILPNYADKGLQIFTSAGILLGEIVFNAQDQDDKNFKAEFINAPFSPYKTIKDIGEQFNKNLSNFIDGLTKIGPSNIKTALFDIFETAFITNIPQGSQHSRWQAALVGRPLALARCQWQLELATSPYQSEAWGKTADPALPDFMNISFAMKLGNPHWQADGLIGYFQQQQYQQFYTVYDPTESLTNPYVISTSNETPIKLSFACGKNTIATTVLFEPHAAVHAYTDIFPVQTLQLMSHWVEPALKQMEISFRVGPLLTIRNPPSDKQASSIQLPIPAKGTGWTWLEHRDVDDKDENAWQTLAIKSIDPVARFNPADTYEIVEGKLRLTHAFIEQPAANSLAVVAEEKRFDEPGLTHVNSTIPSRFGISDLSDPNNPVYNNVLIKITGQDNSSALTHHNLNMNIREHETPSLFPVASNRPLLTGAEEEKIYPDSHEHEVTIQTIHSSDVDRQTQNTSQSSLQQQERLLFSLRTTVQTQEQQITKLKLELATYESLLFNLRTTVATQAQQITELKLELAAYQEKAKHWNKKPSMTEANTSTRFVTTLLAAHTPALAPHLLATTPEEKNRFERQESSASTIDVAIASAVVSSASSTAHSSTIPNFSTASISFFNSSSATETTLSGSVLSGHLRGKPGSLPLT